MSQTRKAYWGWSAGILVDAIVCSYFLPFGSLLLVSFGGSDFVNVGSKWGQVFAGQLVGRALGKAVGPLLAFRLSPLLILLCGLFGTALCQLWIGIFSLSPGQIILARMSSGLFSSFASTCCIATLTSPPSNVEVARGGRIDEGTGIGERDLPSVGAWVQRADLMWHLGLFLGPLIGGALWQKGFGWPWLDNRPAASPSIVAGSGVLILALMYKGTCVQAHKSHRCWCRGKRSQKGGRCDHAGFEGPRGGREAGAEVWVDGDDTKVDGDWEPLLGGSEESQKGG
ncbi:unnamed protein product, partial [Discosporangium mesarthrocarpum]